MSTSALWESKMKIKKTQGKDSLKAASVCDTEACAACSRKVLHWTICANLLLVVLTMMGGVLSGSVGLMADGAQAIFCLITSAVISYSIPLSKKRSDAKFPFGYGKLELVVAFAVYSILFGLGLFVSISSVGVMFARNSGGPGLIGLPFALAAVLVTYLQYRYNDCAGKKLSSWGLTANAQNAKADMLTSAAVSLGILLSQMGPGFAIFDALAAFVVGFVILKDSVALWLSHFKFILDKVPEPGYLEKISEVVAGAFPGGVRFLKPKRIGRKFWVGVGLEMPESASVQDLEVVQQDIKARLIENIDWIEEVDFFLSKG